MTHRIGIVQLLFASVVAATIHAHAFMPEKKTDKEPRKTIELLSDPKGVDLCPFLHDVSIETANSWYREIGRVPDVPNHSRREVSVEFTVAKNGTVTDAKVASTSGISRMDDAAVDALKHSTLPKVPENYPADAMRLRSHFWFGEPRYFETEEVVCSIPGVSHDEPAYRIGPGIKPPRPKVTPDPQYTQDARNAKQQGTVILWAVVGTDGAVRELRVARGLNPELDKKAMEAVRQWKFSPAMKDGKPVAVQVNIEVNFRLY